MLPNAIPFLTANRDDAVAWHYGDPLGEQRLLAEGSGSVDVSHRGVLQLSGPDRAAYLNSLTTQKLDQLQTGESALTLNLNPQGFVLHELHVVARENDWLISCEADSLAELQDYLQKMRFRSKVEVADVTSEFGVVWQLLDHADDERPTFVSPFSGGGRELFLPRAEVDATVAAAPAGIWAMEAMRMSALVPRQGCETDHHTLPHEVGWIGTAVHLNKGCYRGQETISKVERMGQPPRALLLLLLDGEGELPEHDAALEVDGQRVGNVGGSAQHHLLGPIATALVKRGAAANDFFTVDDRQAGRL